MQLAGPAAIYGGLHRPYTSRRGGLSAHFPSGSPGDGLTLSGHGSVSGGSGYLAGFADALAAEIRNELNQTLPAPYYARLEKRPELGIIDEVPTDPIRHHFVEIRDSAQGHKLITLIEIAGRRRRRLGGRVDPALA